MPTGPEKAKNEASTEAKSARPKSEVASAFDHSMVDKASSLTAKKEWDEHLNPTNSRIPKARDDFDDGQEEQSAWEEKHEEYEAKKSNSTELAEENVGHEVEEFEERRKGKEELSTEDLDITFEEPPTTINVDDPCGGVRKPNDLDFALNSALKGLAGVPLSEFLQSLTKKEDLQAQAIESAKEIANDFVANTTDLAEAIEMIRHYHQSLLRKLNLTTIHDFGVKPKTDEGKFLLPHIFGL